MIAATSVLQQQASDIRMQKINWQSYNQSQMISNEDYQCISALDSDKKGLYLKEQAYQSAKTYLNLLSHVSKDTTIQYLLVMIDDLLTVSFVQNLLTSSGIKFFLVGRPLARGDLPGLCLEAQGERLGAVPVAPEPLRRLHHQHGFEDPRQARVLGPGADAQGRPPLLLAVAEGSAHRQCKSPSAVDPNAFLSGRFKLFLVIIKFTLHLSVVQQISVQIFLIINQSFFSLIPFVVVVNNLYGLSHPSGAASKLTNSFLVFLNFFLLIQPGAATASSRR